MLRADDAVEYLLDRQLLYPQHIVCGQLDVVNVSRRNVDYKVVCADGPAYVIKQGVGAEKSRTVTREALICQFVSSTPRLAGVARLMPRCVHFNPTECILVLEIRGSADTMSSYQRGRRIMSVKLASSLGRALGLVHETLGRDGDWPAQVGAIPPYGLGLHRPDLVALNEATAGSLEVVRVIQQSDVFCRLLDDVRDSWHQSDVIHGDLRWDNCTIDMPFGRGTPDVQFFDWELASRGDRNWDVGTVLGEYLVAWMMSAPFTAETPPEQFLHLARHSVSSIPKAARAFWYTYWAQRPFADRTKAMDSALVSVVRYAAVWLAQAAYERMSITTELAGQVVLLLQLSLNMLQRPREAATVLFGIVGEVGE